MCMHIWQVCFEPCQEMQPTVVSTLFLGSDKVRLTDTVWAQMRTCAWPRGVRDVPIGLDSEPTGPPCTLSDVGRQQREVGAATTILSNLLLARPPRQATDPLEAWEYIPIGSARLRVDPAFSAYPARSQSTGLLGRIASRFGSTHESGASRPGTRAF